MAHRLEPRAGEPYLPPGEIVYRLEGEFAFVEADAEAGANHVAAMIRQFERMNAPPALIEEHRQLQPATIHLVIADAPQFVDEYLSFAALPGQGLLIGYHSRQHQDAAAPLLERCCRVLGYEAHLV
jgi:hypothetical protein